MNFCKFLLSRITKHEPFEEIIGYDHMKRLFRIAIESEPAVSILLIGPQASAKTMFLTSLMQLKNSYFADGANSTKAAMIDYLFENGTRYLLCDEIDKLGSKDQSFLTKLDADT